MKLTQHCRGRMNRRGIRKELIETVLKYGEIEQDRYILTARAARKQLELNAAAAKTEARQSAKNIKTAIGTAEDKQWLLKIIDKGGLVVVECDNRCLTAYNYTSKKFKYS